MEGKGEKGSRGRQVQVAERTSWWLTGGTPRFSISTRPSPSRGPYRSHQPSPTSRPPHPRPGICMSKRTRTSGLQAGGDKSRAPIPAGPRSR